MIEQLRLLRLGSESVFNFVHLLLSESDLIMSEVFKFDFKIIIEEFQINIDFPDS